MEDAVLGTSCALQVYNWDKLLELFPEKKDDFHLALNEFVKFDFVKNRFSRKYNIFFSDFKLRIDPFLYEKFPFVDLFKLYSEILDYAFATAVRIAIEKTDHAIKPFTRVRLFFSSGDF